MDLKILKSLLPSFRIIFFKFKKLKLVVFSALSLYIQTIVGGIGIWKIPMMQEVAPSP